MPFRTPRLRSFSIVVLLTLPLCCKSSILMNGCLVRSSIILEATLSPRPSRVLKGQIKVLRSSDKTKFLPSDFSISILPNLNPLAVASKLSFKVSKTLYSLLDAS